MQKIRLSPSGPVIASIGAGFPLRLAEKRLSVTGDSQVIPTNPATVGAVIGVAPALEVGFLDAQVTTANFRATLVCDVENGSGEGLANVSLDLFVDWGNGAGFVAVSRSDHLVRTQTARQIRVDCPSTSAPMGATQAIFQAMISNDLDDSSVLLLSGANPTIDFQVQELLR